MKNLVLSSVLLTATVSNALITSPVSGDQLEKRQFLSTLASSYFGAAKPATILRTLQPELEPSAKRVVKTWGPFRLGASNDTHAKPGMSNGIKLDPNSDSLIGMIEPPCEDCTVLAATANLAYKYGKQADIGSGVYQHHIIMMQFGRTQLPNPVAPLNCKAPAGSNPMAGMMGMSMRATQHIKRQLPSWMTSMMPAVSVFVGGGGSVGSGGMFAVKNTVSTVKSGAYIGPKDTMLFTSEIVNYDPVPKDIYLTLDYEWVPGKTKDLLDVGMGALSLDCSTFEFHPPKDRAITLQGSNWTMVEDGYFVNFTPHIHDGGLNVKVWLNGEEVCTSTALYGASDGVKTFGTKKWETITGYTPCAYMKPFKKGDVIRMTSDYDLTQHILRPDSKNHDMDAEGMAMATFIWAKAAKSS